MKTNKVVKYYLSIPPNIPNELFSMMDGKHVEFFEWLERYKETVAQATRKAYAKEVLKKMKFIDSFTDKGLQEIAIKNYIMELSCNETTRLEEKAGVEK